MADNSKNNILVIGGPNVGKTHFGGQLYGRLNSKKFTYKLNTDNRPDDLTIFEDVLDKLYRGKRARHTETSANRSVVLNVIDDENNNIIFSFPDYGGEQIREIVNERKINKLWKRYIEDSTTWMLFVRLDDLLVIEDIIAQGIPDSEEIEKRKKTAPPISVSDAAFFVELLQMLLYIKKIPISNKTNFPKLTIVLSCWDVLELEAGILPSDILNIKVPMLFRFIKNNWLENNFNIIGLSSTGKSLTDEADEEYIDETPINFGYMIDENGNRESDLTLVIKSLIGTE